MGQRDLIDSKLVLLPKTNPHVKYQYNSIPIPNLTLVVQWENIGQTDIIRTSVNFVEFSMTYLHV